MNVVELTSRRTYRGLTIDRAYGTGWYSVLHPERGYLKADTLAGLKSLIRHYDSKES
jgi:hypothetical protein